MNKDFNMNKTIILGGCTGKVQVSLYSDDTNVNLNHVYSMNTFLQLSHKGVSEVSELAHERSKRAKRA